LKFFTLIIAFLAFLYANRSIDDLDIARGDFYVLALFSVLGMLTLISSNSLLTLYLSLELLSLPLYALVALQRDRNSGTEAAMKYFIMGALASGLLLYGFSLIYGVTGTLFIHEIAQRMMDQQEISNVALVLALVLVISGIAFKFGAVPFHMWVPDVYQGAPTPIVLFISSVPKLAAFALTARLLGIGLVELADEAAQVLTVLAVLSLVIGNVVAIAQTNLKRMLAYSTISHVGFIFLGLLTANVMGYSAALFYVITYAFMSAGAFAVLIILSHSGLEAENIDDLKGLNTRNPWYAFLMLLLMFSLAGVPPTVGFYAKVGILQSLIVIDQVWLAGVAVFFSVIGAFYYLRVVKTMYFDAPADPSPVPVQADMKVAFSFNALIILALGLFPEWLLNLCWWVFAA